MDWFLRHWQTIAALGVVAITAAGFVVRVLRRGKKSGCGEGCECEGKKVAERGGAAEKSSMPTDR